MFINIATPEQKEVIQVKLESACLDDYNYVCYIAILRAGQYNFFQKIKK